MTKRRLTRRTVLTGTGALALTACMSPPDVSGRDETRAVEGLELALGGRIGFHAVNLDTGRTLSWRADERHAMCSTFKALLGGVILKAAEQGELSIEDTLTVTADDLVYWSPFTEQRVGEPVPISDLCAATIQTSDNAAANLLVARLGGPEAVTARLSALGDTTIRLDRWEPELNENAPGDPRDTTSALAMTTTLASMLFGKLLAKASARILQDWMIGATTGLNRLRAGFPDGAVAGDKTGTSSNDQSNDTAFVILPDGDRLVMTSFINAPEPMSASTNLAHEELARLAVNALTRRPG